MSGGDHAAFAAFARRIMRAMARRCADADVEDLADLITLSGEVDNAIVVAVTGLRAQGHSWADIARATGTSRQAAQQRWGVKAALTPSRTSR